MKSPLLRILAICAAAVAQLPLDAATTYYVSISGSDDNAGTEEAPFATLAAALAAAADGDTVQLAAETHTVTAALSLTAGVKILGATDDPADTTIRRAANSYNIFSSIASADALVAGISFAVPSIEKKSSAIGTFTAGTISNCVFTGFCSSNYGGAISEMNGAANESCVVADCTFTGCYSENGVICSGGAIRIAANGYGTIRACRFIDNNSRGGGGAIASQSTRPLILDCYFAGNWSGHGQMNSRTNPGSSGWGGAGGAVCCDMAAGMTVSNCVFASNRVVLPIGTGAASLTSSGNGSCSGGAAYCCNLYHCVVTNNTTTVGGGGLYGGKAYDCLIAYNTAGSGNGGGTIGNTLYGCTVVGNSTGGIGGGTFGGSAVNSIVYGNTAGVDDNWSGTSFSYSCTTPAASGTGNVSSAPAFKDDWTLKAGSPCIDAGYDNSAVHGEDLAGAMRIQGAAIDLGCYERDPSLVEFAVAASATGDTFGYDSLATSFSATVSGNTTDEDPSYFWDMGDGTTYSGTDKATVSHTYSAPGKYTIVCTATAGTESDTATLAGAVTVGTSGPVYVNAAGSGTIPYDTAEKGATSISAALALLKTGGTVFITNGTYNLFATVTVSGDTKLVGCGTTLGDVKITASQYVRPFVLEGSESVISSIRIENTTAPNTSVPSDYPHTGAAILVRGGTVTNCVFYNCRTPSENVIKDTDNLQIENCGAVMLIGEATVADSFFTNCFSQAGSGANGGGAIQVNRGHGVIRNCDFYGNTARASGGAIHVPTARGATAEIWNCTFRNNQGSGFNGYGGAVSGGGAGTVLYNCLVEGNYVKSYYDKDRCSGGGAYNATLVNCTVVGNYIKQTAGSAGHFGAGVYKCAVTNSIVWANSNTVDSVLCNWSESDAVTSFGYSCTSPLADGTRNTDADPVFAAGWHLSTGSGAKSPLLGKGLAMDWMSAAADLAGLPRLTGRKVSPGCYEDPYSAGFFFHIR